MIEGLPVPVPAPPQAAGVSPINVESEPGYRRFVARDSDAETAIKLLSYYRAAFEELGWKLGRGTSGSKLSAKTGFAWSLWSDGKQLARIDLYWTKTEFTGIVSGTDTKPKTEIDLELMLCPPLRSHACKLLPPPFLTNGLPPPRVIPADRPTVEVPE
ncbi:MAG: hypothetical protein WD276_02250 [Actinomycetota bacterium]